jgi:hypothetical protein
MTLDRVEAVSSGATDAQTRTDEFAHSQCPWSSPSVTELLLHEIVWVDSRRGDRLGVHMSDDNGTHSSVTRLSQQGTTNVNSPMLVVWDTAATTIRFSSMHDGEFELSGAKGRQTWADKVASDSSLQEIDWARFSHSVEQSWLEVCTNAIEVVSTPKDWCSRPDCTKWVSVSCGIPGSLEKVYLSVKRLNGVSLTKEAT